MTTTHNHDSKRLHQLAPPAEKRTKSKGPLTAGLVMLACVAACTLPLLLAGGFAAGVSALVTDSDALAVLILGTTSAGALWWWYRTKVAAAKGSSASSSSCGCGGGC